MRNFLRMFGEISRHSYGGNRYGWNRLKRVFGRLGRRRYGRRRTRHSSPVALAIVLFLFIISGVSRFISVYNGNDDRYSDGRSGWDFGVVGDMASKAGLGSQSACVVEPDAIPEYRGEDCIYIHDNKPDFTKWDKKHIRGQSFSELDRLGRCGTAVARLDASMMPREERGYIGHVKPTGWAQNKYPGIIDSNPPYLYNRCHLIAYGLTGENANEKNLITGTRHMNLTAMLPWEEKVMRYLDHTDNHVLYRVTPYFKGRELLARGVEIEAFSIEDDGEGICFHVFVYNVQPGVEIDYVTGENMERGDKADR